MPCMTVTPHAQERVRLDVDGMTCASCAARIERKLNKLDGVEATVNYATEAATVSFDPRAVSVDDLIATVESIGYHAALSSDVTQAPDAARAVRTRLAVAAVLTAPLAVVAMVPQLQFDRWEWLALVLSTPVVFWCGLGFHRATLLNARHRAATGKAPTFTPEQLQGWAAFESMVRRHGAEAPPPWTRTSKSGSPRRRP